MEDAFADGVGGGWAGGAGDEVAVYGDGAGAFAGRLLALGALPAGGFIDAFEGVAVIEPGRGAAAIGVAAVGGPGVGDFDDLGGEFVEKARGDGGLPEAVDAAVLGKGNAAALSGAGDADIGQAPFFLEAGEAGFIEGALVGKQTLFPAGEKDGVEFEALGRVQGHDRNRIAAFAGIAVHDQRDVFEETAKVFELFHGADEFFQVFQPSGGVGGFVVLPHGGVAGFIENLFGQFVMGDGAQAVGPIVDLADQLAEGRALFGL